MYNKASEFLKSIDMHPCLIDVEAAAELFCEDMQKGLSEDGGSSLPMIPSFASALPKEQLRGRACVVDAGGTNLRASLVEFSENGPEILDFASTEMPGRQGTVPYSEYVTTVAKLVQPFYKASDTLGYCFSFTATTRPDGDATLWYFNKEVSITHEKDLLLCRTLVDAVQAQGEERRLPYALVNDSVAAMLAVPAVTGTPLNRSAGFILGTGHNVCYAERCSNIVKNADAAAMDGFMAINIESACFDKLTRGKADLILDAASANPSDHPLEKMVSGAYFGDILLICAKLASEKGLLSADAAEKLRGLETLATKEASAISEGAGFMDFGADDLAFMRHTALLLAERAGKAVSLPLLASRRRSCPEDVLMVSAEGSTVHRFTAIKKALEEALCGRAKLLAIDNATILGTAAAALTRRMA